MRAAAIVLLWTTAVVCAQAEQQPGTLMPSRAAERLREASGRDIYVEACATCHAADGTGAASSLLGFRLPLANGHELPDFTDCATNTVEPLADWAAVVTRGGRIRALDRHMPAFGDALTPDEIERVIRYLWAFCPDPAWPRGDLNFPRALFTEKAFPENEFVVTTGLTPSGERAMTTELSYEHRLGARGQYEVKLPISAQQSPGMTGWARGVGDLELSLRRTLYASVETGKIVAGGLAVTLPTGSEAKGLGHGYVIAEPFASYGQMIGTSGFLQLQGGYEIALDRTRGRNEAFARGAVGLTLAGDSGFGRAWSPMLELLAARPEGGAVEWDAVPQMQVSLSRLQHVLVSVGVRTPLNGRDERRPQLVTYVLWDWFDGGLFRFWRE